MSAETVGASPKPTVYVVDDDPSVRIAIARLLVSVGLPCESFATATDFLKRAEHGISGCLVLDVRMPGLSGLELQRALSASGQEIPVIFVTAHADVPLTVRAMKEGALDFLTKPFDDQALLDAVNNALRIADVRREAGDRRRVLQARYETLTPREREVMGPRDRHAEQADCDALGTMERKPSKPTARRSCTRWRRARCRLVAWQTPWGSLPH